MPWFSSKGQIIQVAAAIIGLVIAASKAYPDFSANRIFSAGPVIFYLLLALALLSGGQLILFVNIQ
jgi:hypothetical protein